uniref:Uncharacterized protein LOC114914231 n=1 Tax=Elaeis guineensis var. tenera TaxID=51953 RepID=A0A8N4F5D2_ELAGV|nr:uncharacterized protein LOC114914231 [Elaeis guineensis]
MDYCPANRGVRLVFDPKTSPHFKVVMITNAEFPANDYTTLELLIFSSATNDCEVSTIDRELPLLSDWLERYTIRTAYSHGRAASGSVVKTVEREDRPPMRQLVSLPRFSFARDRCMEMSGKSGGRVHYAVCCELKLLIWMLEDPKCWALKHVTSTWNLIQQHKEGRHRRTTAGSIRTLAFHPDLDVIFLQVEWNIYSFHPTSRSFELLVSKRGANPDKLPYRCFNP